MTIEVSGIGVAAPRAVQVREFLSMNGTFQAEQTVSAADFAASEAQFAVQPRAMKHTVYNFEVEGTHTYIAGGYRVHNTSTLAFYDPDTNGVLTAIYEDSQGRLVWESVTPDGGKWVTVSTTNPGQSTVTVTKTYTLGQFDANGNPVLDANGNPVSRFYLQQENMYQLIDGEQVLVDVQINDSYWLYGDEVGDDVSAAVTPFILQAIGAESPFERLAAGTLIDTLLQNIAEGGLNFLHHSLLYAPTNGETTNEMIFGAWEDFGVDLGVNFAQGLVSITSELIMAEIFSSVDINTLPEEFMAELVSKGIENVLSTGMDNFIDNIFGSDSALGQAYEPLDFDFTKVSSYVSLIFSLALDEVFPQPETIEGAIASAIAKALAGGIKFATDGFFAFLPGMLVTQIIGFIVGKIFDAIFDKDPQAFANLQFNAITKTWSIASIDSDDGGSVELATQLGTSVADKLNEIAKLLGSTDLAFASGIRIGHYEKNLRNGDGINYGMTDSSAIFAAIVAAVKGMTATDGDLKALRILDLANLEQSLIGLEADQAFSMIYSKLRIASDYQYYLENTEYINQLLLTAPDSALAKSWLATILSAESSGLNGAYAVTGTAGNNLYLAADGRDTIDGGAGNDTIRSYGEADLIYGGDGDDLISAGIGADTVDGGAGIDTITFDESGRPVSLDLSQGIGLTQDAQGDVYINIENVVGSRFADLITGGTGANDISGLSGNDVLFGHGGSDTLHGNTGNDQLFGDHGTNAQILGNDVLYGDEGDDTLSGDGGIDTVFGGDGYDMASYRTATAGVIASLETNTARTWEYFNGTYGYVDTMNGIEGLIGSNFGDRLSGDATDNRLEGGLRNDTLAGGRGSDTYVYSSGDGADLIQEFAYSGDQSVDRLKFTNLMSGQVAFGANTGDDLVIRMADGGSITIENHFTTSGTDAIEQIEFMDGTVLNLADILLRSAEDQKDRGIVYGTRLADQYNHALGDGSYIIRDSGNNTGVDRLNFINLNPTDVRFDRAPDNTLLIFVAGQETITISGYFNSSSRIEEIAFADGTVLNFAAVSARADSDATYVTSGGTASETLQGGTGTNVLYGGDGSDTYIFNRGDGQDVIDENGFNDVDVLHLKGYTPAEVILKPLEPQSGHLVLTFVGTGDRIEIRNTLTDFFYDRIEQIRFDDGTIWNFAQIVEELIRDQATSGNDFVSATELDDTLYGNLGNDTLHGGEGSDTYVFTRGDGEDLIEENGFNDTDVLFLKGYTPAEVILKPLEPQSEHLVLTFVGTNDRIEIRYTLTDFYYDRIEQIRFEDGTVWNFTQIIDEMIRDQVTSGNDVVSASNEADTIYGNLGNDTVHGGDGSDTYVFTRGDGQDLIEENGFNDTDVLFLKGYTPAEVILKPLVPQSEHLVLTFVGTNDRIEIRYTLGDFYYDRIEQIRFEDGTVWNFTQIVDEMIRDQATAGNDTVSASNEADTVYGNLGNDTLHGGNGNDTYVFNRGDGQDLIDENGLGDTDVLFLKGYTPAEVILKPLAPLSDHLVLTFVGTDDRIEIRNTLTDTYYDKIEQIRFEDGTAWNFTQIVDEMIRDQATSGNDAVSATIEADTLYGNLGNDTLFGGDSGDTYVFNRGDGQDLIEDNGFGDTDVLLIKGYTPAEVIVKPAANGVDLVLTFLNTSDSIVIRNTLTDEYYDRVEQIRFEDGTIWSFAQIIDEMVIDQVTNGNDSILASSAADTLYGNLGNDTLHGGDGGDTYIFNRGDGQDLIDDNGFGDTDVLVLKGYTPAEVVLRPSTSGSDLLITFLGSSDSIVVRNTLTDAYYDRLEEIRFDDGTVWNSAFINQRLYTGSTADDFIQGTSGIDNINGLAGNDTLRGLGGNDTLIGGEGNDSLDGGTGADAMTGGTGNDVFVVDSVSDVVTEAAGGGIDTAQSSVTLTLAAEVENLVLLGTGGLGGTGNGLDNSLTGNAGANGLFGLGGNDTLAGGDGNDTLDGGTGADSMIGGAGNDTYVVESALDVIVEVAAGGTDVVQSSVTYTLADEVETLTLTGTAAIDGTGNSLDNVLTGNAAANLLSGLAGNDLLTGGDGTDTLVGGDGDDTLDGGLGTDTLTGGAGNDTYILDATSDVISEVAGGGIDTVQIASTLTLGAELENLVLLGTLAINGTGNAAANTLTGNSAANTLSGLAGNDSLAGLAGNDTLVGGDGHDTLDGGAGTDRLEGGIGNDTYVVDTTADVILEAAGGGTDLVQTTVSLTLGTELENLTLLGSSNLNGTGNGVANILTGNAGSNSLYGLAGNDTLQGGDGNDLLDGGTGTDSLVGGLGNDTYVIDAATDVIVELAGEGTDTVQSSFTHTLAAELENLTLLGTLAINGTGNTAANVLTGNSAANSLSGLAGNDTLSGLGGNDTLVGGDGDDVLDGGSGTDSLNGGAGNDTYVVDVATDVIVEAAGGGTDTVQSTITLTLGTELENLTLLGSSAINGTGNAVANTLTGNSGSNSLSGLGGNDLLYGGAGNDTLDGGAGTDTLVGGVGDDTYTVDVATDVVTEAPGGGNDLVNSSVTYTLSTDVERLTLTGTAAINGTGNTLSNTLTANGAANVLTGLGGSDTLLGLAGNDTLHGGDGDDSLDGGAGIDSLAGGAGNDTYVVDVATDVIVEAADEGIDTVQSAVTLTLGANFENLVLLGTAALNGTGNAVDNTLTGNSAANSLSGLAGNDMLQGLGGNDTLLGGDGDDTLDGGAGTDSMTGGAGNDVYFVDATTDVVVEAANGGIDTVQSLVTRTLGAEQENLILLGTAVLNGTGNALGNVLTGNAAANNLSGLAGDDTLLGGDGNDTLQGGDGNDILDAGAGTDSLVGGAGNDIYMIDALTDVIVETAGGGNDTVQSSVTLTLAAEIENLTLLGTAALNGTGNAAANVIAGNAGSNTLAGLGGNDILSGADGNDILLGGDGDDTLDGGLGADSLEGGAGNDAYTVDTVADLIVEAAGGGIDTVNSLVTLTLGTELEHLTLLGTAALSGTGNAGANIITGNAGANILNGLGGADSLYGGDGNDLLDGGAGADAMAGGAGDDTYTVDSASDVVTETAGGGNDQVRSYLSWTLAAEVESLTLLGNDAVNGTGNALANTLTGNSVANTLQGLDGNDTLQGGAGDDTLDGGTGTDAMDGGSGNDTYIVDATTDAVTELAYGGIDLVMSSATHTLSNDVENLTLTGTAAIGGTGNAAANTMIGNAAANLLSGRGGNDILDGGAGNDTLDGGLGADTLDGGEGADAMIGGTGNDTFIVDNVGDTTAEQSGGGIDLVRSSVSWTLAAHVDNLLLTGAAAINGTGNTQANALTGNAAANLLSGLEGNDLLVGDGGNDTLAGGAGDDILVGGLGSDILTGGAGADLFLFDAEFGTDQIDDFSALDRIDLSSMAEFASFQDLVSAHMTQAGADVLIADGLGNTILIKSTTIGSLTADQFIF